MIQTATQHMVATDADPDDDFAGHFVGVDSSVGLYVTDSQGNELNFSHEVQESIHDALQQYFMYYKG